MERTTVKCWDKMTLTVHRDISPQYGIGRKINDILDGQLGLVAEIIKYPERRKIAEKDKFAVKVLQT